MDYKICIVKNNYSKKINLNKYIVDWFKNNTQLEITIDTISTNFNVIPQTVGNDTFSGIICSDDIIYKLRTVITENKYNAVILYADNLTGGIRVSVCNGANRMGFLYNNTELIQLRKVSDNGKEANHELFHAFFAKANRLGIKIEDNMDTYYNDSNTEINNTIDTNREVALQKLTPYFDKICSLSTNPKPIVNPLSTWKHFKLSEKTGSLGHTVADLEPTFVDKLDILRDRIGFAINGTSGYRTEEENRLVGGVAGSAHTKRVALDIACTDSKKRIKIVGEAYAMGFIGIGIAKDFVHLDMDTSNERRIWLY